MAEKVAAPAPAPAPAPKPASSTIATPKLGTIVLVRSSATSFVPAIVVNDFNGQNAPGTVSLVVFLSEQFNTQYPVKFVPNAQAETAEIPDNILATESYAWWSEPGKGRELKLEKEGAPQ